MNALAEILAQLVTTITTTVDQANARADAAQAKLDAVARIFANDNADAPPTPPKAPQTVAEFAHDIVTPTIEAEAPQIVTAPSGKHRGSADDLILAVLTHAWMTARMIHDLIVAAGATITRAAVYQRMDVLAATRPELVEQNGSAKVWRAKGGDKAPTDDGDALPTLSPTLVGKSKKVAATIAANDQREPLGEGLHHGDGIELMKAIPDQSVGLVLCDPPYGCSHNKKIDTRLDQDAMWAEYRRILKPTGSVILFAAGQFMSDLLISAPSDWFKYDYSWVKDAPVGSPDGGVNRPLRRHENALVFSPGTTIQKTRSARRYTYEPIGAIKVLKRNSERRNFNHMGLVKKYEPGTAYWGLENVPDSILSFPKDGELHPYQKPVAMLERLIRTHSNEGDLILDNCAGSGSLDIAAINTDRRWIAIEMDDYYYGVAEARIEASLADKAA